MAARVERDPEVDEFDDLVEIVGNFFEDVADLDDVPIFLLVNCPATVSGLFLFVLCCCFNLSLATDAGEKMKRL